MMKKADGTDTGIAVIADANTLFVDAVTESNTDTDENSKKSTSTDYDEVLTLRMQYLQNLSAMHKQATTNDLFVFMYGFLSSVLIGIAAYLLKKGASQAEDVSRKYNEYHEFNKKAGDIFKNIITHKNSIFLNFISQGLSEALTAIMLYDHALEIDYLIMFKQSINQVALWCKGVDFAKDDKLFVEKFRQRLGHVERLYESAAKKPGSEIDEFHRKYIQDAFNTIDNEMTISDEDE